MDARGAQAAMMPAGRRRVLEALTAALRPLDAAALARELDLHVTTARHHLDQLVTAGLARRSAHHDHRRGRPRMLYAPTSAVRHDETRDALVAIMAGALAHTQDGRAQAVAAGRRWGDALATPAGGEPAGTPVADDLVAVLDRLGFEPDSPEPDAPEPGGVTVKMHGCPFREAAAAHPEIVCAVHRGLVERFLDGSDVQAELVPFVEPNLCLVRLGVRPV